MVHRREVLLTFLLVACGEGLKSGPPPLSAPKNHRPGTICGVTLDADHGCSRLRDPFDDRDVDGCPDWTLDYTWGIENPDAHASELLADLAAELQRNQAITNLHVVAVLASSETVALAEQRLQRVAIQLGKLGVAANRLSYTYEGSDHPGPYVYFEPYGCADGTCASYSCLRDRGGRP